MARIQVVAGYANLLVVLVVLFGLLRRRLWRLAYAFSAYLFAVAVCSLLQRLWPAIFFHFDFYARKESLYNALCLTIALEIAALTFAGLPGARRAASVVLACALSMLGLALWIAFARGPDLVVVVLWFVPRLANATALVLLAVWALALWFRAPLHPLHRVVLRGLVPYLLVFSVLFGTLRTLGWEPYLEFGLLESAAYFALQVYWAKEVWRMPLLAPADAGVVQALQPWRLRAN